MLKTVSARKRHFIPCFVALFYLVIGAYALHPHFHSHKIIQHDHESRPAVSEVHYHSVASSLSATFNHQTCPICDFLAVCSAIEIGFLHFSIPSYPDDRVDAGYRLSVTPLPQTGFHIRGPPSLYSC